MRIHRRMVILIGMLALAVAGCRGVNASNGGIEQLVKEDQATVYAAFTEAFSEGALGGASQYSNLWNGGMQTFVEKASDTKLSVTTKFNGQTATAVHFTFKPENSGRETLVTASVMVDQAVMRTAFAGTPKEEVGELSESAQAIGLQRLMVKYAQRIENSMPMNVPSEGWQTSGTGPPPEFYEGMPEDMVADIRRHDEAERQRASSAPMVDPNAARQRVPADRDSPY